MAKLFNVEVAYRTHKQNITFKTRREFLDIVSRVFDIKPPEVRFFKVDKSSSKEITVNDLSDKMKVEIRNRVSSPTPVNRINGQRSDGAHVFEEPLRIPCKEDLLKKFAENRVLNGIERRFLMSTIDGNYEYINRMRKQDHPPQKVNKKVQVSIDNLKQFKCTHTQTDDLVTGILERKRPSSSKDLNYEAKRLALEEKGDPRKACKIMTNTFDERRNFILISHPPLSQIKEKYPLLFTLPEVRNEINRIFYDGKDIEFLANIKKYSHAILSIVDEDDTLLNTVTTAINSATTPIQKQYTKEVGALLMLSNLLREKRTYLNTEDESWPTNNYPRIEAPCKVQRLFFHVQTYKVIVEGKLLCEAFTFQEAILCLIGSYFIFNISYPDTVHNTLVVMEKIFLEANDTDISQIDDQTQQIIKLIQLKTHSKN